MSNVQKYRNAFIEGMEINPAEVEEVERITNPKWDSIGFMSLLAIIEEDFRIELDTNDILNFTSYLEGIKILKKHGIYFEE